MGDGKAMSRDHLEHTLKNAEAGHPIMGKWANDVLAHVAALEADNDRLRQERYDALSAHTTEGMSAAEWQLRTGKAERERDELRSEIARLKPSGQVAEDAEMVVKTISALAEQADAAERYHWANKAVDATSRLAAKAQAHDASERLAEVRALAVAQMTRAYDVAVADNATLLDALTKTRDELDEMVGIRAGDALRRAINTPHPGDTLLEEHRRTTEALEACREHVRQTGNEHRKALLRARNEGRESIAGIIGALIASWHRVKDSLTWRTSTIGAYLEDRIRAMKEPEQ